MHGTEKPGNAAVVYVLKVNNVNFCNLFKANNKKHQKNIWLWYLLHKCCPVDTGRKLNVLCTFNLRPVPTW